MRHEELLRKGAVAELREKIAERETQIRAKLESISLALNEFMVSGLAELRVDDAAVLMQDLEQLMDDYRAKLARLGELEG